MIDWRKWVPSPMALEREIDEKNYPRCEVQIGSMVYLAWGPDIGVQEPKEAEDEQNKKIKRKKEVSDFFYKLKAKWEEF